MQHLFYSAEPTWGSGQGCSTSNMAPGFSGLLVQLMASSHWSFSTSLQAVMRNAQSLVSLSLLLCMPVALGMALYLLSKTLLGAYNLLSTSLLPFASSLDLPVCFKECVLKQQQFYDLRIYKISSVLNAYALTSYMLILVLRQGLAVQSRLASYSQFSCLDLLNAVLKVCSTMLGSQCLRIYPPIGQSYIMRTW